MRIFNLSAAAEKALAAALTPSRPAPDRAPAFMVHAASGASAAASSATGAFRALRLFTPRDRETARIYDEDGWCLYR